MTRSFTGCIVLLLSLRIALPVAWGQQDPGPRKGAPGGGGPYLTLTPNELSLFSHAFLRFGKQVSVSGTIEKGKGLGPTFNGNSCAMCHAQPTAGGSSTGPTNPEEPHANPQVALATLDGATNSVPSFITASGPVRVARFVRKADGSADRSADGALDGEVHGLYTIAGRKDAKGCVLKQPDFARQMAENNVVFRIPTPLFGLGLVENTADAALRANLDATASARSKLGIGGSFNLSGGDGTIMRFGWKAHSKSLLMFAGEALSVEEGVTNEIFPNKRDAVEGCVFNPLPEDSSELVNPASQGANAGATVGTVSEMSSDAVNFAAFVRLLAPPKPAPRTPSAENGARLFHQAGCDLCHSPALTTSASTYGSLSGVTYHPYSDFALHHMGSGLADGIVQGSAGADQFRTAPLWGVGQRLFFLHDGRTPDLLEAIKHHSSSGSEADAVIRNLKLLSPSQIQDLLNFLRSL